MLVNIEKAQWDWVGDQWSKVSDSAKDLVKGLLEIDPAKRLSVEKALEHPWVQVRS